MTRPDLIPIRSDNLQAFCEFLSVNLGSHCEPAEWREVFARNWLPDIGNYGFGLWVDGEIVGALGAIYARRSIGGKVVDVGNIVAWTVLESYRSHSLRLAAALLGQSGLGFTNFSATNVVAESLKFFKFRRIDTRQIELPNLPCPGVWNATAGCVDEEADVIAALSDDRRQIALDHRGFTWIRQVAIPAGDQTVHVVFKVFKNGIARIAVVMAVSDVEQFTRVFDRFRHYLLFRLGIARLRVDQRYLSRMPKVAWVRRKNPRKLYLGSALEDSEIDDLYSELVCLDLPETYF